jgi:glycosyltransferase involved in cell wall biosynthesis
VTSAVSPVRVLIFQNRFLLGGQEQQTLLHLKTLDRTRWEAAVACLHLEGEHLAAVRALGIEPRVFDVGRQMLRPNTMLQVARLAAMLRRERIALVHAQDLYTNVLGVLAGRMAGCPAVVTRVDLAHAIEGYRRPLLQMASRAATRVVVNALAIRDLCLRDGVDPSRIAVVRNGIDLSAFDAAARREPSAPLPDLSRPTAIMVANMHHPVKGQEDVLVAMRHVLRDMPQAQLLLVGEGVRRPALERMARELLGASCALLGRRLDVPALLGRVRCLVSASYAEGISNAILEAMAARLPVVATAVGGTPELIRDDVSGFLVSAGAPAHLASRLRMALRDRALGARLGEAARKVVEREFGVEQMRRAYERVYLDVLGLDEAVQAAQARAG